MSLFSRIADRLDSFFESVARIDKRPFKRIAVPVIFALVSIIAILYALGFWDFTFISRPIRVTSEQDISVPADDPATPDQPTPTAPVSPDVPENPAVTPASPSSDGPVDPTPAVKPQLVSDLVYDGYHVTSGRYDWTMRIGVMNVDLAAPKDYSVRNRSVYRPSYEYEYAYGAAKVVYELVDEARPSIEAYGGYLFVDSGEDVTVFDSYGNYVCKFNESLFFAYSRDKNGNPLFYTPSYFPVYNEDETLVTNVESKTYYALGAGGITQSDHLEEIYYRGANMDLPATYGAQTEHFDRSVILNLASNIDLKGKLTGWRRTLWGFSDAEADGEWSETRPFTFGWYDREEWDPEYEEPEEIDETAADDETAESGEDEPKLTARERFELAKQAAEDWKKTPCRAYNYSEGYACVANEAGQMWFIDEEGNELFETRDIYGYNAVGRPVVENLLLPLTNGEEALGFYYFDHGLVRVRRQIYDALQLEDWDTLRPEYDDDELIYANGEKFTLAEGYDIRSYSDGLILLEKNGRYGFMDYTGAWLIQPELEDAKPYVEGLAPVKQNGKWGVIDTAGYTIIPFGYDSIQTTSSGMIVCHSEYGWTVYAKMAAEKP